MSHDKVHAWVDSERYERIRRWTAGPASYSETFPRELLDDPVTLDAVRAIWREYPELVDSEGTVLDALNRPQNHADGRRRFYYVPDTEGAEALVERAERYIEMTEKIDALLDARMKERNQP